MFNKERRIMVITTYDPERPHAHKYILKMTTYVYALIYIFAFSHSTV